MPGFWCVAYFVYVKRSGPPPPPLPLHPKSISPCIVCPKLFTGTIIALLVPSAWSPLHFNLHFAP